jgi:membrane-associated phospholipid phosphatase
LSAQLVFCGHHGKENNMRRYRRSQCLFGMILLGTLYSIGFSVDAQSVPAPSPSPSPTVSARPSLERDFFKNILRDQKAIWRAPLHLERNDAKWMIPSGIGAMALFTTDRITGDDIARFDSGVKASRIISYPGSFYGVGAVAATFYLVGRKTHNLRARETGILSAEAVIDGLIVSQALKVGTQRARPDALRERSEFFDGGSSFPSGHSVQAWAAAAVIASEYHDQRKVQLAAYAVASAVSVVRFTGGKHYVSDVLIGSVLGYGIGRYVYRTHHRKDADSVDTEVTTASVWPLITPRYNPSIRQYGVGLTWHF